MENNIIGQDIEQENDIQTIGLDIGRGFTKVSSEVDGKVRECKFKSIIGEGRKIDLKDYEDPIFLEYETKSWFVGLLAEKESQVAIRNNSESKASQTAEILMVAALSKIAVKDNVKILFGVPYDSFKKSTLEEVKGKYKDKEIKVKDIVNGGYKTIKIIDVNIYREADAALTYEIRNNTENKKSIGLATIGFKTTETVFYEKGPNGLKFIDLKSDSIPFGNRSVMSIVRDKLKVKNIKKDLNEIDTSEEYNSMKAEAYEIASEKVNQHIEDLWSETLNEMDIYIAGGTSTHMKFKESFRMVEDPQMATARGLDLVAKEIFKKSK